MSQVDHQRLRDLFEAVMDLPPGERAALLDAACSEDPGLRAEIDSLLLHHDANVPVLADQQAGIGMRVARQTEQAADIDRLPDRIGHYRIVRVLASGGMGTVYEAEQETPVRRRVALKVIKLGMDTREVVARFEQERQALAMMDHPNIARVFDAGATATGRPYFVMELCLGDSITKYCDKNQLAIPDRLHLFVQVCQAVQHAHQRGIIHRDLKPSNILVTTHDGRPHARVIDFGIAKATAGDSLELTVHNEQRQLIGTPEYMSPEQAEGSRDIDTRTDVYSLGVLLYELLAGQTPFADQNLHRVSFQEIRRIICEVEPSRPSVHLRRTIHAGAARRPAEPPTREARHLSTLLRGELDWIVLKAIEKDRQRRYDSVGQFCADVERYLAGEVVLAAPPTGTYRFRKFVARHRPLVIGSTAALLALIAGLCGTLWQAGVARREARVARDRSDELRQVADLQAEMLSQIDVADAGVKLFESLSRRFESDLGKSGLSDVDRTTQHKLFESQLGRINPTDLASEMIDVTLLKPAIASMEKQLGRQPAVLAALQQTLASMYRSMGRFSEARPLQESALAFRRRVLGDEHPDTLASGYEMCLLLRQQGEIDAAESLLEQAYPTSRRVLGPDHPTTLNMLSLRGGLHRLRGRLKEAEACWQETLERRRRVLGDNDRATLFSINNMGYVLEDEGRLEEAGVYYREALEKRRQVLGDNHPDTLISLNFLGQLCVAQGKLDDAAVYWREALDKRRRTLGDNHPQTLHSLSSMAELLRRQGHADEAEPMLREVVEKRRWVLGLSHPLTLDAINKHADLLESLGRWEAAEPLRREAVELLAKNRKPADRDWITARIFHARALVGLKRHQSAERELLEAYESTMSLAPDQIDIRRRCAEALQHLYEDWAALERGKGHDAQIGRWRNAVHELQP